MKKTKENRRKYYLIESINDNSVFVDCRRKLISIPFNITLSRWDKQKINSLILEFNFCCQTRLE